MLEFSRQVPNPGASSHYTVYMYLGPGARVGRAWATGVCEHEAALRACSLPIEP